MSRETVFSNLSALNQGPLGFRIQAACRALTECSHKEAALAIETVVQAVFGVAVPSEPGMLGWGLNIYTKKQNPAEYQELFNFLCSQGLLLNTLLHCSLDSSIQLQFPIAFLPEVTQCAIFEGTAGPLYSGKIQHTGPGKLPTHILLNCLEYYLFHYCYYLLHVGYSDTTDGFVWTCVGDAIYPSLLEDYLVCFLPCDGAPPPPSLHRAAHNRLSVSGLHLAGLMASRGKLIDSPRHEQVDLKQHTWASQTVLLVLVEMWVNSCQTPPLNVGLLKPSQNKGRSHRIMCEHIRAIRMIIKHCHYFSNSIKAAQPSPIDGLRKNIWALCRKNMYLMFLQLLAHWPLDSSFRLLLEAWLSFIQPWRYLDASQSSVGAEAIYPVDWKWQRFIAENLLLYSGVFQSVLPRLLRLDLSAPKNAHMLYRIAKVLSLPNLAKMLESTEDALLTAPPTAAALLPSPQRRDESSSSLSPHTICLAARAHLVEFEGSSHSYTAIFGPSTAVQVQELLSRITAAEAAVRAELQLSTSVVKDSKPTTSALGTVMTWLSTSSSPVENSLEELEKTLLHLQAAAQQFLTLFRIDENALLNESTESSLNQSKDPETIFTENGPILSDDGRRQLLRGFRRKDLKYDGDPDLRPIGTQEYAALVRVLYSLAIRLNNKYSEVFEAGYYSASFTGRMWRCVLQPPLTVYEYRKGSTSLLQSCGARYPTRIAKHLPPRLSFRTLARKQVLWAFGVCFLMFYICGPSFDILFVITLLAAFLFILCILYKRY